MKVYSNSALAAILETLSPEPFLLSHRCRLVELDPHVGTALGQFALLLKRESIGIADGDSLHSSAAWRAIAAQYTTLFSRRAA